MFQPSIEDKTIVFEHKHQSYVLEAALQRQYRSHLNGITIGHHVTLFCGDTYNQRLTPEFVIRLNLINHALVIGKLHAERQSHNGITMI